MAVVSSESTFVDIYRDYCSYKCLVNHFSKKEIALTFDMFY